MKELYQRISEINPNEENRILTVLDGGGAGAKALVSGHSFVWTSCRDSFPENLPGDLPACGIVSAEGREIFSELLTSGKKLVICGGGHVSVPVIRIGKMLGFHVTVLEDREGFAARARECGADRAVLAPYEEGLAEIGSDADTYFVIVTRAHRHDAECLRRILTMPRAYAGMMGSRRRVSLVKEMLAAEGADREALEAVHTPIGLKIGAETPEEIAVSILAEIIEVKNRSGRIGGFPEPVLEAILDLFRGKGSIEGGASGEPETAGREEAGGVLATIVRKHGSAPREPGSKMLVREDGTAVGTVGGGSAEALITSAALELLKETEKFRILHLDLSADAAGEEGMVCGGNLDVMLERI